MISRRAFATAVVLLLGLPAMATAAATIELYGTFTVIGVTVTVGQGDDPDQDATAAVSYRTGAGAFKAGHPLTRVAATRFVGSVMWLSAGTTYDVRVTITDPDGGALNGVVLDSTGTTRAEITIPTPQRTHVVSPSGSGTACTETAPCALAEALSKADAGSEIRLRAGVYREGATEEGLQIPRSGTASAPIVIRSFPGESAILDGADPGAFTWVAQGGGIYRTTTRTAAPHVVLANGQRLFPYQTLADLQSLRYGVPGFFASGTQLSVRLPSDADPTAATMVISQYGGAFLVDSQSFVYFVDLTFRHYGVGEYPKTIYLIEASDCLVRNCTFNHCDTGVAMKYGSHRTVVEECEFSDNADTFPWQGVKDVGFLEDGGVLVYSPMTGRGTVIRRNEFSGDFDGAHICPEEGATTQDTDFYENTVTRCADDGIEVDGLASNVRLWGNTFSEVLMGISLAPVYTGPVYAVRNVIYAFGRGIDPAEGSGSGFKLNSGYDQSGVIYLYHNTVDAVNPSNSALTLYEPGSWKGLVARNNIWSATNYAIEQYNVQQPLDLDYDDLVTSRSGELVWWQGKGDDGHLRTLAALQGATGQEPHGLAVPPSFAGASAGNYALASGSALIDQGLVIPGINDGFGGAAPDIGAFEYRGATGCTVACSATVPTTAQASLPVSFAATASVSGCTGQPTYDWDFGDASAHQTKSSASHVYQISGTYTWKLTVTVGAKSCSRSGAITVGAAPPPVTYLVPAVAHNPGASGTQWRTDLAVVNRSGVGVSLTLVYYSDGVPVTRTKSLAHGAAIEWRDVLVSLFGLTASASSSGVVQVTASMPIGATSRTYNQVTTGTYGQSYPALRSADGLTAGREGLLPQLRKSASFRTNVGVANLGLSSATVAVKLWNASGIQVGGTKTMTVAAGRWAQQYDIFASVGAGTQESAYATVEVQTAGASVWAYASLIDVATGDPTTIPVLAP
jgi:PKD repeat protein